MFLFNLIKKKIKVSKEKDLFENPNQKINKRILLDKALKFHIDPNVFLKFPETCEKLVNKMIEDFEIFKNNLSKLIFNRNIEKNKKLITNFDYNYYIKATMATVLYFDIKDDEISIMKTLKFYMPEILYRTVNIDFFITQAACNNK